MAHNEAAFPNQLKHRLIKRQLPGITLTSQTTVTDGAGTGQRTDTAANNLPTTSTPDANLPSTTSVPVTTTTPPVVVTTPTTTSTPSTTSTISTPSTTSTTPTTTSTPTTSSTSTRSTTSSTSSRTIAQTSTSFVIVSQSFSSLSSTSSSSSASVSASATSAPSSNGPGAGTVVGIVAGALVGVVVLSALVGYFFRRSFGKKDDDMDSPFDKDDFRRASMRLDDAGYSRGHSPQMSEYSMSNLAPVIPGGSGGAAVLGRSNTYLPGAGLDRNNGTLHSPRPPTEILNHFQYQQSFQPGQIMPASPNFSDQGFHAPPQAAMFSGPGGAAGAQGMNLVGGYPMPVQQQHDLDQRNLYGQPQPPQQQQGYPPYAAGAGGLERNNSQMSAYSDYGNGNGNNISRTPSTGNHSPYEERPLSLVREEEELAPSRSGTPVNSNVQQSYFTHHAHNDSLAGGSMRPGSKETQLPAYDDGTGLRAERDDGWGERRAQRTLSVRNGGYDHEGRPLSEMSDGYGGYQ